MFTYAIIFNDPSVLDPFKSRQLIPLTCRSCNCTYERTKHCALSDIRRRGRASENFCSLTCAGLHQRTRIAIACHACNEPCERKPCDIKKSQFSFCSNSCAVGFHNKLRTPEQNAVRSENIKASVGRYWDQKLGPKQDRPPKRKPQAAKTRVTLSAEERRHRKQKSREKQRDRNVWGPSSRIYILTCAHSGHQFVSRRIQKYAPEFTHMYSRDARAAYKFTFNVYNHPDLFDLAMIEEHGWFSVGGKSKKPINLTGVSRDHVVSVNEAIKSGYDPFYIKHPLNCRIMLHADNNSKNTRSDMTYEELVGRVDEYEAARHATRPLAEPPPALPELQQPD